LEEVLRRSRPFEAMIPQKGDPASGSAGKGGRMGRKNQGFALMPYILQGIQHFRRHFWVQG
jgi:hypothetical protein